MPQYTIKPKADRDLDSYADYLSTEASVDVALRFLTEARAGTARAYALGPGVLACLTAPSFTRDAMPGFNTTLMQPSSAREWRRRSISSSFGSGGR